MEFTTYKERHFAAQSTPFTYSIDISLNNTTGTCEIGFKDASETKLVYFTLENGQIKDQAGKMVYGYVSDEEIALSGTIHPLEINPIHNYLINETLVSLDGEIVGGTPVKFYVDPTSVTADIDLTIAGKAPDVEVSDAVFVEDSKTGTITITNNENFEIKVFEITSGDDDYVIDDFDTTIAANSTGEVTVTKDFDLITQDQLTSGKVSFDITLIGTFGEITKTINADTQYTTKGFLDITGVATELDSDSGFVATIEATSKNGSALSLRKLPLLIKLESVSGSDFFNEWEVAFKRDGTDQTFKTFTNMGWTTGSEYLSKDIIFNEAETFLLRVSYTDTTAATHSVKLTVTAGEGNSVGDSLSFDIEGQIDTT